MNQDTRGVNSVRNIIYGVGTQVILLFLSFFSRTIFISSLGAEYLGINGLFINILVILSLAELGLGNAMVYSLYRPIAEKDKNKIAAMIQFYKKVYYVIAGTITLIGFSLLLVLDYIVKTELEIPNLKFYFILFLANSVLSYLLVYKTSMIIADQKKYIISSYTFIFELIKNVIQILILIFTQNYILYLIVQMISTVCNNFFISRKANKLYPFIKRKVKLSLLERKDIFSNMKAMFIYKLSSVLINGTDNIIISILIGTIWVGYYSNYYMLIQAVTTFVTIFFTSFNASLGNLIVSENKEKSNEIFSILLVIGMWIAGFTSTAFFILFDDFITLWIGAEFVLDTAVLIAIVFNFYLSCILNPLWSFREATGLFKKTKYVMLVTAGVNLFLSIFMGIWYGLAGVLFATCLARLLTYFWYEPLLLFKGYLKGSTVNYFLKQFYSLLLCFVSVTLTLLCTAWLQETTVINFIVKIIVCLFIPNLFYFFVLFKTKEFKYVKSFTINMIRKKYKAKAAINE